MLSNKHVMTGLVRIYLSIYWLTTSHASGIVLKELGIHFWTRQLKFSLWYSLSGEYRQWEIRTVTGVANRSATSGSVAMKNFAEVVEMNLKLWRLRWDWNTKEELHGMIICRKCMRVWWTTSEYELGLIQLRLLPKQNSRVSLDEHFPPQFCIFLGSNL